MGWVGPVNAPLLWEQLCGANNHPVCMELPQSNFKNKRNLVEPVCEWIIISLCCAEHTDARTSPPIREAHHQCILGCHKKNQRGAENSLIFHNDLFSCCSFVVLQASHWINGRSRIHIWCQFHQTGNPVNLIFIFLLKIIAILFVAQALFKESSLCAVLLIFQCFGKFWSLSNIDLALAHGLWLGDRWGPFPHLYFWSEE